MAGMKVSCGWTIHCPADLKSSLTVTTTSEYDFIVTPVVHPRYKVPDEADNCKRCFPSARPDLVLASTDWSSLIAGSLSRDLNLESGDSVIRQDAARRLIWELNYVVHLCLPAAIITLTKGNNPNLGRLIRSHNLKSCGPQIWIRVPFSRPDSDTWSWWNEIRAMSDFDKKVFVILELTNEQCDKNVLDRWLGEPVKALVISTSLFLVNANGFPVLPRSLQKIVLRFFDQKCQFIIEGRNGDTNAAQYHRYLSHVIKQNYQPDPVRQQATGYEDFLQSPLQPLMDNLESRTYEVFERDPIKYSQYKQAIFLALQDRVTDEEAPNKTLILMVLGAGRGPLVRAALGAAEMAGRKVKVYAVEKNPYAVVTLMTLKEETWHDQVDVISSDMREWKPSEDQRADIIISELLGSFGDNELSPECLYSAQHLMKKDAISIPCSYTSWIGPIQSSKLFQEVRGSADPDKNPEAHFETPYVVHLQNRFEIAKPQPLFTFEHPVWDVIDNTRYASKTFKVNEDCVLNGFAGYFECVLYKDVNISINPATHSEGMFSWFPIFFPLKVALKLTKGTDIELLFWRLNNNKEVWYEWTLAKPVPLPIHNPNGRSYTIGL